MNLHNQILFHPSLPSIRVYNDYNKHRSCACVINEDTALLAKYSRRNPSGSWMFSLSDSHREQLSELDEYFPQRTFVAWICTDKVCLITAEEYAALTDVSYSVMLRRSEWVIHRYGKEFLRVAAERFPRALFKSSSSTIRHSLVLEWSSPDVPALRACPLFDEPHQ